MDTELRAACGQYRPALAAALQQAVAEYQARAAGPTKWPRLCSWLLGLWDQGGLVEQCVRTVSAAVLVMTTRRGYR